MAEPGFWDDQEKAQGLIQDLKTAKAIVDDVRSLDGELNDLVELVEMAEGDEDQEAELTGLVADVETKYDALEFRTLFSHKNDGRPAMVGIQSGSGGTDASDFAEMLLRMYLRWAERHGGKAEILELSPAEEAGIKSATLRVVGENAFGWLRGESGVHRIIRMSPFNAAGKRQTAFAAVDVIPEIADDDSIVVEEKDLRVDTYRAGGKGGQHVNTTDSAVRITHIPSGLVVQCQNERSQHKNKAQAMKVLRARLAQQREMEREKEIQAQYGDKGEIAFGSQIRTYWIHPQTRAKDHRTKTEDGNVHAVLDGDLQRFMESHLRWAAGQEWREKGSSDDD